MSSPSSNASDSVSFGQKIEFRKMVQKTLADIEIELNFNIEDHTRNMEEQNFKIIGQDNARSENQPRSVVCTNQNSENLAKI